MKKKKEKEVVASKGFSCTALKTTTTRMGFEQGLKFAHFGGNFEMGIAEKVGLRSEEEDVPAIGSGIVEE